MNEQEVRCFCKHTPLLAMCGLDDDGKPFVHVKRSRNGRTDVEVVAEDVKVVKLRCRDCGRWHAVRGSNIRSTVT